MSHAALSPHQFSGYMGLLTHVEQEHGHQPWRALRPGGTVLAQEHERLHRLPMPGRSAASVEEGENEE
jgi:hypothetical protein